VTDQSGVGPPEQPEAGRTADEQFAAELRRAFTLAAAAGALTAPPASSALLERMVETAANLLAARAASLFLVDEEKQELVIAVALGPKAQEVRDLRVPLGHGIAGLVALSGQPMMVSEVQKDPRLATDVARAVGYWPGSILCIPLQSGDRVIGVLELFDKEGAPSFNPTDMEVLGYFGNLAALAIEQARAHGNLARMISDVLAPLTGTPWGREHDPPRLARAFLTRLEQEDAAYRRTLELARLVRDVAARGERELEVCRAVLGSFWDYVKSGPAPEAPFGRGA
jgi:GAF domain-containing protein